MPEIKFAKLVHLVGLFIKKICYAAQSHERKIYFNQFYMQMKQNHKIAQKQLV
jgi:hypothetical protein